MNEDQFIELLRSRFDPAIGDDCFVIERDKHDFLVTTDLMTESVHFGEWMDPYSLGWKIAAVNISDIAAMGGRALFLFLDIALKTLDKRWIDRFLSGLSDICTKFNLKLSGGDTTRSTATTVAITAIGTVPHKKAILRSGAKAGDLLCVSGFTGLAAYGLDMLQSGIKSKFAQFQLTPEPEAALALELQELDLATAMIDLSDGIYQDGSRLAKSSDCGIIIEADRLLEYHPLAGSISDDKLIGYALTGGEDYRLLFAIDRNREKMIRKMKVVAPDVRVIGKITNECRTRILFKQKPVDIKNPGFLHFGD